MGKLAHNDRISKDGIVSRASFAASVTHRGDQLMWAINQDNLQVLLVVDKVTN